MPKNQPVRIIDQRRAASGTGPGAPAGHTHDGRYVLLTNYTAADVLAKLLTVDGPGSGLDADTVDGSHAAAFVLKSTLDANTVLYATTDNTPAALAVPISSIVGRKATGDVVALTAGEGRTVLGLATTDAPTFASVNLSASRPALKAASTGGTAPARFAQFIDRNSYQSVNLYFDGAWNLDDTSRPGSVISLADGSANISLQIRHASAGPNPRTLTEALRVKTDGSLLVAGLIVNEDGTTTGDFRAESDTEANMLFLDASADLLYLGGTNGVKIDKGGLITTTSGVIRPAADSTTALQLATAGGIGIVIVDTTNSRLVLADGANVQLGTSTGTKFGVGATAKLAFHGATPIAQRSHVADPSGGATVDAEARTAINSIMATLEAYGFHATG